MKSVLRIVVMLMLVISTSFWFSFDNAQAAPLDNVTKVYESAKKGGKESFCGKADAWASTFSVRSFEGELCNNFKSVAALSQYTCKNPEVAAFKSSECDTKGLKYLNGADPVTVLKQELASTLPTPLPSLINLFFRG